MPQAMSQPTVATWRDYYGVTKPKVVLLLVFTSLVGMALSMPTLPPLDVIIFGNLGIALAAASAAAYNHVLDRRIDAQMHRTEGRPLPTGALTTEQCIAFATALGVIAMLILVLFINALTALLTFASLIGYAVIYTAYLKRATPQNIVIGGAAGAMPPVLGWAAVHGEVGAEAWALFLIIFIWTPPHFWALAIHRRDDYARVGMPMLPVTHGIAHTKLQIVLYTILLILVTLLPFLLAMNSLVYAIFALGLGIWFLKMTLDMMPEDSDPKLPMKTFVFSINYLMVLFAVMLIDHYLFANGSYGIWLGLS